MRIHSRAGTNSAPLSAMRPTRSMQFSCTCATLPAQLSTNMNLQA